jgi:hypothetical protein
MSVDLGKLARLIVRKTAKGQTIDVGRSPHHNCVKLKIKRGPFGFYTQRFVLTEDEYSKLAQEVNFVAHCAGFRKGKTL